MAPVPRRSVAHDEVGMGFLLDLVAGIPINAVLRERLAEMEAKFAALEAAKGDLQQKLLLCTQQKEALRLQIQQMQEDHAVHYDVCKYCRRPQGKLVRERAHPFGPFADLGVKVGDYQCAHCGKEYEREHRP